MPYCGQFGCACCTCQECFNSKCTCKLSERAIELLNSFPEELEDEWHVEIKELLQDARDTSW